MKKWMLSAAFVCFAGQAMAYEITGKVISVADGDTLTILDETRTRHKIRLADIDAPESGQPYGNQAKQRLRALTGDKQARADCREKDKYQRNVCTVYVGDVDVNADLVTGGYAWVYERYNNRDDLPLMQKAAKQQGRGLWSLPEAQIIRPSDWRHGQKNVQKQVQAAKEQQRATPSHSCGSKHYCKEMSSCAEAKFYLNQCGLTRLDRDGDGIPCESLCQ